MYLDNKAAEEEFPLDPPSLLHTSGGRPQTRHVPATPELEATPKQVEFLEAILSGKFNYLAIGGGIRGTKTYAVLIAIFTLCRMFPGSRWAIVRKDLPTLRRNLLPSFEKLRPTSFVGPFNQAIWTSRCTNGSEIILFPEGIERDPDLERWKGLEVNGFVLEEGSELSEKSFSKAIERAGSWVIPDVPEELQPPPLVLSTFNPCQNWPKRIFYLPWKNGKLKEPFFFLPSTIADNPYATDAYIESLRNLPPAEYRRFVEGDWESADDPDQLILAEWVWAAQDVEPSGVKEGRRLGVDVARFGDDSSIMMMVEGNTLIDWYEYEKLSTDRFSTLIANYISHPDTFIRPEDVRVDGVGLGAGVVDGLAGRGFNITEVTSGARPFARKDSFFKFADLRSQMWWELREKFRNGRISLPAHSVLPDQLLGDLTAPRYEIVGDRLLLVERKDDIKKRLGRSTDYGDAFAMAMFDFPKMPTNIEIVSSYSRRTFA